MENNEIFEQIDITEKPLCNGNMKEEDKLKLEGSRKVKLNGILCSGESCGSCIHFDDGRDDGKPWCNYNDCPTKGSSYCSDYEYDN